MASFALRTLGRCLAWAAIGLFPAQAAESWLVEVRETAGIERFSYPVSGTFEGPADAVFELRSAGSAIPAQFTRLESPRAAAAAWSVDFAINLGPLETRRLRIERSETPPQNPARRRGLTVETGDHATIVRHPSLAFHVPNNLQGLFEKIDVSGDEFLIAGAAGLIVRSPDGSETPLILPNVDGKPSKPHVVKHGPLAVVLRFDAPVRLPNGESIDSNVILEFPLGKSWVCVDWLLDGGPSGVAGIGADLQLRLVPDKQHPVLADVGANGWTYAALRADESLAYLAEPPNAHAAHVWSVDRIMDSVATPYALPGAGAAGLPPQGWAHLLDSTRCTAIAVDGFAASARDSMRLSADGFVRLRREFVTDSAAGDAGNVARRLRFWLHVVRSPAQIGAATSPQSMQFPPEVRIVPWQATDSAGE